MFPLSPEQIQEWAILDTFDALSAYYDRPDEAASPGNPEGRETGSAHSELMPGAWHLKMGLGGRAPFRRIGSG